MHSFERCVVLVADDEPMILRTVSFVLTRHGYVVLPAPNGPEALRLIEEREGPIHLALLDVVMPGMNGPELFRHIERLHPNVEVLFMSGYRPEQVGQMAPEIEEARFISKPFLPRDIVHRVNSILGNEDVCMIVEDEAEAHA